MSKEELGIRLRRTFTNKFSSTLEPKYRKRLREEAFDNAEFCHHINKAVEVLDGMTEKITAPKESV